MKALTMRADAIMTRFFTRPSITWNQAFAIVIPLIAENLFTTLFGMINTAMISSSGVTSLSAVSLVDTLNTFLFVIYTGIATGAGVVVANYRGRKDALRLHLSSVQTVTWVTLFTVATTLFIVVFHGLLLNLLFGAAEPEILSKARLYLLGGSITLPLLGFTNGVCGVLRGIGEGKTSLLYTGFSTAKYVLFNIIFLTVLDMGVFGLVLSVTFSRIGDVLILLLLLKVKKSSFTYQMKEFFHLDFAMFRSILKIAVPCVTENMLFQGGRLVMQSIIVVLGTNAIVAFNIAYSIMTVEQALAGPISTAMFTIAGICIGSDRPQDVRDLTKNFGILGDIIYGFSLIPLVLFFDQLVGFYNAPADTIPLIFKCVMMSGISLPFIFCQGFTYPSVFRAVGDGTYCTVVSLVIMWVVRVFGGYVLGVWCKMGVIGIWYAMELDWILRCIIFSIRFKGNKWLSYKVLD